MSNLMVVLSVSYAGLCIGTFIRTNDFNDHLLNRICISIFTPIPILMILVWIATSIAREKYHTLKDYCEYPILLALSLATYADAVKILTRKSKRSTRITAYRYRVPAIRKTIVTNYVAA